MGLQPLTKAPPKLYELFPKHTTLEDKAFKFLETYYELGSYRRTGHRLKIDPKTVKAINDFLMSTSVGQRFNALLIEQTEDFYSAKTLTSLFEGWHKEIMRVEDSIQTEDMIVTQSMEKDDYKSASSAQQRKLKLISEKRMWMSKLLDASLSCRPISGKVDNERKVDDIKATSTEFDTLLDDFDPNSEPSDIN
jgi:hypothetical protein